MKRACCDIEVRHRQELLHRRDQIKGQFDEFCSHNTESAPIFRSVGIDFYLEDVAFAGLSVAFAPLGLSNFLIFETKKIRRRVSHKSELKLADLGDHGQEK